ncbi:MAG: hypothetical protein AAB728_01825 [Patescibacteria group bacterium]
MTPQDHTAPATKQDIALLMESIGKLYNADERWKDEIIDANERWKDEIIRHVDVTVENIRHELRSANREEIEVLKDRSKDHGARIQRLESAAGLSA